MGRGEVGQPAVDHEDRRAVGTGSARRRPRHLGVVLLATTHAAVADGKASRFRACEVTAALAVPTRSTVVA